MALLGNVKERITVTVTVKYICRSYNAYGNVNIYIMETDNGDSVVWKTSTEMVYNEELVRRDDVITLTGTVKKHGEYNGTPQTELSRCKVNEVVKRGLTQQERDEIKRAEQEASLKGKDFIWTMPYKQYKQHYADCETIAGSFHRENGIGRISVIIREGRLKPSGTRGMRFRSYELRNKEGNVVVYMAISEDHAIAHAQKDFPGEWEIVKVLA